MKAGFLYSVSTSIPIKYIFVYVFTNFNIITSPFFFSFTHPLLFLSMQYITLIFIKYLIQHKVKVNFYCQNKRILLILFIKIDKISKSKFPTPKSQIKHSLLSLDLVFVECSQGEND